MQKRSSLLVLSVLLATAACGGSAQPPAAQPKPPAPALVQVENAPGTEPHAGLQHANIVFEYLTEGGITRFTAVYFAPSGGDKIEPVRSARLVTLRLLHSFGGVLFYSGASNHVYGLIQSQHLPGYNEASPGGYFQRDSSRDAPHNLYTTGSQLQQGVSAVGLHRDYSLWPTGAAPTGGTPATSISFAQTGAHQVMLSYAGGAYTYRSDQGQEADADQGGAPVKIANVVLLQVAHHGAGYTEDVLGAEGIDFDLQRTGPATLYRDGKSYGITWDLSNPDQPLRLLGAHGKAAPMAPGLTWVFLVDPGLVAQAS